MLNGTTEVVPFPFVLSLGGVAPPSNKVKSSGQECPLHMGWHLFRLRRLQVAEDELIGARLRPSELGPFPLFLERFSCPDNSAPWAICRSLVKPLNQAVSP